MDYLPALVLLVFAAVLIAGVARPMLGARRDSLLDAARRRAFASAFLLALVAAPTFAAGVAGRARERAVAEPPGPGWSPDAGLSDVESAAGLGALATLFAGPSILVVLGLDLLARRKLRRAASGALQAPLDVGLGDAVLERPQSPRYRIDATPEVLVRGDLGRARKLLRRAVIVHGLALLLVAVLFLMLALVALSAAMY